jgi:methyltransferase (TIGR00027 family)
MRSMGEVPTTAWALAVRTRVIDDLIGAAVKRGIRRVVNLACGLDTRPYRLNLPAELTWIEADFPALLDFKEQRLALNGFALPVCRIERARVDLSRAVERDAFLDRALPGEPSLVLTEGLLCYLEEAEVINLAQSLRRRLPAAPIRGSSWVLDLFSAEFLLAARVRLGRKLKQGNAPLKFGLDQGSSFFAPYGWDASVDESLMDAGQRLGRDFPVAWAGRPLLSLAPRRVSGFFRDAYRVAELS